jgi:hypothetical protein
METFIPIELREYAQYEPVFRIPDIFRRSYSIKMVLDRAYLPAAFEPYERQTEIPCFYFSFSDIDKRFNYPFMFCRKKGLNHIKESILLIKQIIM